MTIQLFCAFVLAFATISAAASDTIRIALTGPYSGGSAPMGVSTRDGAKLAVADINAAGGIQVGDRKMTIEVIERDDEAKNERGALIAQELAAMPNLSAIIGTVNTGVAVAGDKFIQEKGITKIICPAAGSKSMSQWVTAGAKDLSIFRFAAHDGIQTELVVREAIARGLTKVAILHDSTNYGVSGREDLLNQIKQQGGKLEVVALEKFNIGDKDLTAQLIKARSAGAQAILAWAVGPELAAMANGMAKLGMKLPLLGGWALSMSNFLDNAGKNAEGATMPQTFIEEPITPRAAAFIEAYHKAYNVGRIPSPVSAAQGHDAVLLLAAAIRQAGSTDTGKIKLALEDLKEPIAGVIATWKKPYKSWDPADPSTHEAFRTDQVVMGVVKDGRITFANDADRERLRQSATAVRGN
jgi:branched-chain amino acid transport system substrate-binding protein